MVKWHDMIQAHVLKTFNPSRQKEIMAQRSNEFACEYLNLTEAKKHTVTSAK